MIGNLWLHAAGICTARNLKPLSVGQRELIEYLHVLSCCTVQSLGKFITPQERFGTSELQFLCQRGHF